MFIIVLIITIIIGVIVCISKSQDTLSEYNSSTDENEHDSGYEHFAERRVGVNGEEFQVQVKKTLETSNTQSSGMVSTTKRVWNVTEDYNNYTPKPHKDLKPAAYYKVRGRNTQTNRMKGLKIYAYSESDAIERGKLQGLTEPFTVEYMADNNPTERQIEVFNRNNINLPTGVTKDDISNILDVLFDGAKPIKQSTVDYILSHNIVISPYSTERAAQWQIAKQKNKIKNPPQSNTNERD